MAILASLKFTLILAGIALITAIGWRLERGKLIAQRDAALAEASRLSEAIGAHIKLGVGLTARIEAQNRQIESLLRDGEALRGKLFDEAREHFHERAVLRKRLTEFPPLPLDHSDAVRETARTLKQMVGGE